MQQDWQHTEAVSDSLGNNLLKIWGSIDLATEFTHSLVNSVVKNCEYINSVDHVLLALNIWDVSHVHTIGQVIHIIIHQTHYEKSDWSRAFNQFTIACELDMINAMQILHLSCQVQRLPGY